MAPSVILTIVAVFGAVALTTGLLAWAVLSQTAPERRRLERAGQGGTLSGVLLETPSLENTKPTEFSKTMATLMPRSPKDMTRLRKRMTRAGYTTMTPVAVYTLGQIVCPILLAALPLLWFPMRQAWPGMAILGLIGWLLPGFVLDFKISQRQKVIRNGLPDALDLLIVCLESGSAMDQAILKVSEELEIAYPPLADEFRMIITETRAGKPRLEAFKNFADRTGVDDVRALVAMLVQTDRFGTSVSQALRTHAETARTKRRQRAEERAAKIGVKLVFPLVFLLFPAFFTVTLGPAVIRFIRVFFGQVLGGQ